MTSEKIFIVEDEAIVAESLNDHLESLGYTVSGQASSGEQALLKISKNEVTGWDFQLFLDKIQ